MTAISSTEPQVAIKNALAHCLDKTELPGQYCQRGKVRDNYDFGDHLAIVTTDRQSAFDRVLASIPYKGQVLNLCSQWWFERTKDIVPNHLLAVPHPNISLVKKCTVFPVECIVRAYLSGHTKTSLWTHYQNGTRQYCGHNFEDGLTKNQALPQPIVTPTTKSAQGDRPISAEAIIAQGLIGADQWQAAEQAALQLFDFGARIARERGLILVDTKYEFGLDESGTLCLVDELHTPDSSRFWRAESYESRLTQAQEPEHIDKEFLRLWFLEHCDPYGSEPLPEAPAALRIQLSQRYIELYETLTGTAFEYSDTTHLRAEVQNTLQQRHRQMTKELS